MKTVTQKIHIQTKATLATRRPATRQAHFIFLVKRKVVLWSKKQIKKLLLLPSFHTFFRFFVTGLVLLSALYGVYAFIGKTLSEDVVISKSEIISRVEKLAVLPPGELPQAVVRVEDPETLQKQNSFYQGVKEGDYVLIYQNTAIIYDLINNKIVNIKQGK